MTKIGIPLDEIRNGQFNGPRVSVTTCTEGRRRPTIHDRNFPLLTQWSLRGSSSFADDGELWQLIRFDTSGNAVWARQQFSAEGPSISTIETDDLKSTCASGTGTLRLYSDPVKYQKNPVQFFSSPDNIVALEIQAAGLTEEEPYTFDHIGMASFDKRYFNISPFGNVTLAGGSKPSIQLICVDSNELPGVSIVEPTEDGEVFFGAGIVDPHNIPLETKSYRDGSFEIELQRASACDGTSESTVGAASFNEDHFEINEKGNVRLANAGLFINRIVVNAQQGDGYETVKPHATGSINLSAKVVANCDEPIRTVSRDDCMIAIEAQYAEVSEKPKPMRSGMSHYDVSQFSSDDGFVQLRIPAGGTTGTTINLAFCNYQGRITVHGERNSLSYKNPGYVVLPSNKTPGMLVTHKLTEDLHIDMSDLDGYTFGTSPGVAWAFMMPIYLGFMADCNDENVAIILTRVPRNKRFIGYSRSESLANSPIYSPFLSIENANKYHGSSIETVGSFRVMKNSQDCWRAEEFDRHDGLGRWNDEHCFFMPPGQNGAEKKSPFFLNQGTYAPTFDICNLRYWVKRDGTIDCTIYLDFCTTTGVGLSGAAIALPYNLDMEMAGFFKSGRINGRKESITAKSSHPNYLDLFFDDFSPFMLCDFEASNKLTLQLSGTGRISD